MKKAKKPPNHSEPLKARKVYTGSNGGQTRSFCRAWKRWGRLE